MKSAVVNRLPLLCYASDNDFDRLSVQSVIGRVFPEARLHLFSNAEDLLEWLGSQAPDGLPHIILVDFILPVLNGYHLPGQIRHISGCEKIPMILLMEDLSMSPPAGMCLHGAGYSVRKSMSLDRMEKELVEAIVQICQTFHGTPSYWPLSTAGGVAASSPLR